MPIFLYRLIPPRPTFPADITAPESAAMERHFAYWHERMQDGTALVVGPVHDPKGTYGIAIIDVPGETEARGACADDPVLKANLGFGSELHPMPNALVRGA